LHRTAATANTVNNSIRQAEAMNKVYSIQAKLTGEVPTLMEASRYFVKEGPLTVCHLDSKTWGKQFQRYHFFLFNDAIVYAAEQVCVEQTMVSITDRQ
jgi:hypothetical protein